MKRLLLSLMLAGGCVGVPAEAQSPFAKHERVLTTPEGYVCYRAAGPLEIDGRLDEESWRLAEPTASFVDISGRDFPKPLHDTRVKMLWDDDYLYIGARLEEKDIRARLTQRDTIIYHDNDFEVFIDPDGDGHNYFEIENNARGVVFDLMLDRPYRSGGNFMIQWDCPGLRLAVRHEGTLNDPSDTDKAWTVEMAIPRQAVALNFDNPLRAGRYWRVNFSRVQWLKPGEREENWVWQPTGKVDMHMPERWGFLYFSDKTVGEAREDFRYPYDMAAYKLLWSMFHTQNDARAREGAYLRDVENFLLTDKELSGLPADADIQVEATDDTHVITVTLPSRKTRYTVNHEGRFAVDTIAPRKVKNWVWIRLDQIKEIPDLAHYFKTLKEGGISGVMIQGYDEAVYRQCREAGLEAHYWKWTMNRKELLDTHPDWFAVNRKGESTRDNPAYVEYYRFLCPYHDGVATHIARDYVAIANLPYVSGVHLDYVRFPDVVLPVGLWKNYGIEQTRELPEYDYCYCDVCREKFKAMTGVDPMELPYPMESQSWINFRLDGITRVVDSVTRAVKLDGKRVTAAVFPGPSMARKMVRQDWGNWHLDAYYPMIYNGFYHEDAAWVARSVRESVRTVDGRAKIYAGLMFPDIKDDFEAYLDAAFDNGASGVSFFDGPDEEHLRRFKRYLDKKGLIVAE